MAMTIFAGLIIVFGGVFVWVAATTHGHDSSRATGTPSFIGDMRRRMLASAADPEELAHLKELDQLELHRRHLIC